MKKAYFYFGIAIIILVAAAFSIALLGRYIVLVQPEYKLSMDFVINNKEVISDFGDVSSLKLDNNDGTEVNSSMSFSGVKSKEGSYQFQLVGTKRSGVVRIIWNSSTKFTPTEIDEVSHDGSLVQIWKS